MSIERPKDDFELLLHVDRDPVRLLGRKSLALFHAFESGYPVGLPLGASFGWLNAPQFEAFVRERFPIPERWPEHLSAGCFVDYLGGDDCGAFDLFVELRREYFAIHPETPQGNVKELASNVSKLLEAISQRPRMYFSHDIMGSLIACLNGCIDAELAYASVSQTQQLLERFQVWIDARHPWSLGQPWHRVLLFQNTFHEDQAVKAFYPYFEMFLRGEQPDALTPVGKAIFETNPGLKSMSDADRQAHKNVVNKIFY